MALTFFLHLLKVHRRPFSAREKKPHRGRRGRAVCGLFVNSGRVGHSRRSSGRRGGFKFFLELDPSTSLSPGEQSRALPRQTGEMLAPEYKETPWTIIIAGPPVRALVFSHRKLFREQGSVRFPLLAERQRVKSGPFPPPPRLSGYLGLCNSLLPKVLSKWLSKLHPARGAP